jgi:DNA-binding SARP family transcriptional activator
MGRLLRFGVLGPVTVVQDGVKQSITAAMPRAILAALLLAANKPVPSRRLEAGLWGDTPPRSASAALYNHVHRLRRRLGDFGHDRIQATQSGYQLEIRAGELDLDDFGGLYDRGRKARLDHEWAEAAEAFSEMLLLWRGDPVADVEHPVLSDTERERLTEMRLQALHWRSEAELQLGNHVGLIADLRALVAENPLSETFAVHLILALHRSGRHTDALEVFQKTRLVLREELGVSPGPELAELHLRILERDPGLDWTPPARATVSLPDDASLSWHAALSAPPTQSTSPALSAPPAPPAPCTLPADSWLIGRESHLDLVLAALTSPPGERRSSVVSFVGGMSGVGKTALAVHAAHLVRDRFPDGQLFADLRGSTASPAEPRAVLGMFLRQLGEAPHLLPYGTEERSALFRTLVADRRVLIALDDARDAEQVIPLVPGAAACRVLVTHRRRLIGRPGWSHVDLDVLSPDVSRRLLVRIAGPERPAADPRATATVVEACAGLPLAVVVAAGQLAARPEWRMRDLADRLSTDRSRLDELSLGDQSVRTGFEAGYTALAGADGALSPEQRAFCMLGLWKGRRIGLAAAAVSLLALPVSETERILESLVDVYLLRSPHTGLYEIHDLLRTFAAERAARDLDPSEREAAAARIALRCPQTAASARSRVQAEWDVSRVDRQTCRRSRA